MVLFPNSSSFISGTTRTSCVSGHDLRIPFRTKRRDSGQRVIKRSSDADSGQVASDNVVKKKDAAWTNVHFCPQPCGSHQGSVTPVCSFSGSVRLGNARDSFAILARFWPAPLRSAVTMLLAAPHTCRWPLGLYQQSWWDFTDRNQH